MTSWEEVPALSSKSRDGQTPTSMVGITWARQIAVQDCGDSQQSWRLLGNTVVGLTGGPSIQRGAQISVTHRTAIAACLYPATRPLSVGKSLPRPFLRGEEESSDPHKSRIGAFGHEP